MTTYFSFISAAISATCCGSSGSSKNSFLAGEPLGTEQKPQPRVHKLPRIMKVAAPRWKHSWMFGQRADSQTVCRLRARRSVFSLFNDWKCVAGLRAHAGSRGRGWASMFTSGGCKFDYLIADVLQLELAVVDHILQLEFVLQDDIGE